MNQPFGNVFSMINQFQEFQRNFRGNPEQQVQQMLNTGRMTQEQLNSLMPFAQQLYNFMNGNKPLA